MGNGIAVPARAAQSIGQVMMRFGEIDIAALVTLLSNAARDQSPDVAANLERDAAIDAHLVKARTAAGFDFTGTLARLCVAPARIPLAVRDATPSGRVPARDTWYIDPAKVFEIPGGIVHASFAADGEVVADAAFSDGSTAVVSTEGDKIDTIRAVQHLVRAQ